MIEDAGFFVLYLFYGLVFFTIGAAIISKDLHLSKLKVARILWILALFAFLHGLSEWLDLFARMNIEHLQEEYFPLMLRGKFILTGVSFAFLFWFGAELFFVKNATRRLRLGLGLLTGLIIAGVILVAHASYNMSHYDIYLRHFIAVPGATLAGIGFFRNAATVEVLSQSGARNLKLAGCAMLLYGVFSGVLHSGMSIAGFPIEGYRALAAFLFLHGMVRALKIFNVERNVKIEESFQRLAQSEKMVSLGKLSAGIAHEINNPLANALIGLELLEKDLQELLPAEQVVETRINAVKRNLDRASKIAGELLFFSHNRETELEPLNLNEVINRTFQLIGSRQTDYEFTFELGEIPRLDGIPWKVEEVLLNLLVNAMDAAPEGGSILIRTRVKDRHIICTIKDQGTGVKDEDISSVFDPFFTTKEPGKGTGLGLSICFGIMQLHGGEIRMNSKPGDGTSVQLLFPLPKGALQ